jgi:hypothetical protein
MTRLTAGLFEPICDWAPASVIARVEGSVIVPLLLPGSASRRAPLAIVMPLALLPRLPF